MNRRDFVKFFGVSVPAVASAKALAALPESEPKIKAVEPVIFTLDEVQLIEHVTSWTLLKDYCQAEQNWTVENYEETKPARPGRIGQRVYAEFELVDEEGKIIIADTLVRSSNRDFKYFRFGLQDLDNALYKAIQYTETYAHHEIAKGILLGERVT